MASNPYPPIESWHVPNAAVAATLEGVVTGGRRGVESGAFWLGRRETTSAVKAVMLLRGRGIVESEGLWEVEPGAYGRVASWARDRALVLLGTAHIHGHGVPVRLSRLDRSHLVRAPDLLAIVIGDGGEEQDPTRWSWNVFTAGAFHPLEPDERARRVVFVDEPVLVACGNAEGVSDSSGDGA